MHGCEHGVVIMEHGQLCFSLSNGRESWRKPSGRATIRALLCLFLCLSSSFCLLTSPYQGSVRTGQCAVLGCGQERRVAPGESDGGSHHAVGHALLHMHTADGTGRSIK